MVETKISVIMSVYNSQKYLCESISSILNQTFKDFEFLILNDGSTDKSDRIIRSFVKKDKRIKYFKRKRRGLTSGLNFLIKKSKCKFLARQDADDISHDQRLELQYDFITKNKDCVLLGTNGFKINERGNIMKKISLPLSNDKIQKRLFIQNSFIHSSVMIKKKTLKKINLYDEKFLYSQDYDCWCRISKFGKINNLKKHLIKLRIHNNSITKKKIKLQNFYACKAAIKFYKSFKNRIDTESHKKIIFYLKGNLLPNNYIISFSELNFFEKIKLLKYPKILIQRLLFL